MNNQNLATVNCIYEAFGKRDIPTIIECVSDKVQWEHWADYSAQKAGVPWMQAQKGKQGVIDFFNNTAKLEVKDFQVLSMMSNETQVAAEFIFEARVPTTGNIYRDEEIHVWTFDKEGKVIGLPHYADTAKLIAAVQEGNSIPL